MLTQEQSTEAALIATKIIETFKRANRSQFKQSSMRSL